MVGDEEEEYMGIRGGYIHSPKSLDPMEGVSPLEPLGILKNSLQNSSHILDNNHSV